MKTKSIDEIKPLEILSYKVSYSYNELAFLCNTLVKEDLISGLTKIFKGLIPKKELRSIYSSMELIDFIRGQLLASSIYKPWLQNKLIYFNSNDRYRYERKPAIRGCFESNVKSIKDFVKENNLDCHNDEELLKILVYSYVVASINNFMLEDHLYIENPETTWELLPSSYSNEFILDEVNKDISKLIMTLLTFIKYDPLFNNVGTTGVTKEIISHLKDINTIIKLV